MSESTSRQYHIVGVAGVGMCALAEVLRAQGNTVSGSDRHLDQGRDLDVLRRLQAQGVRLTPQDGSAVTPGTEAVLVSTAIEPDNADLLAARTHAVPVVHRAAMLAKLVQGQRCVAVAGTAGKTTVTAMIGWLLEQAGLDPWVVNGGAVVGWDTGDRVGNVRAGHSDLWVVETDESDRSFLNFHPEWAVITNLSKDHFELDETVTLFRQFARQVRRGIVSGPGVQTLMGPAEGPFLPEEHADCTRGDVSWRFSHQGVDYLVPMLGRHNAVNAFNAVRLCRQLGVAPDILQQGLKTFRGVRRRLEMIGWARGITVVDDYAHNPAKIKAAWQAVGDSGERIIGVWRPHGFGPLAAMMPELAAAFGAGMREPDRLFLLPVYYAGGTAQRNVSSEDLAARLQAAGRKAEAVPDYETLMARLLTICQIRDVVLCMGARDPDLPVFARQLVAQLERA